MPCVTVSAGEPGFSVLTWIFGGTQVSPGESVLGLSQRACTGSSQADPAAVARGSAYGRPVSFPAHGFPTGATARHETMRKPDFL